jgi:hypothetical protein
MDSETLKQEIAKILNLHDAAFRAQGIYEAHGRTIDAALAANGAALALLRQLNGR